MVTNNTCNLPKLTSDGQLIIGDSTGSPKAAVLTPGANIAITNAAGSITIAATGGGIAWSEITANSQTCIVSAGYFDNNAAPVNMELPATAALGNEIKFSNKGTGGFKIIPAAGQSVSLLTQTATYPQYLQNTDAYGAADLVCATANTQWNVINHEGTFSINIFEDAQFTQNELLFVKSNFSGWGSGFNLYGDLGNLTKTNVSSPVSVVGSFSFKQVAGAYFSSYWLGVNGSCRACGLNTSGELGTNNHAAKSSPFLVVGNHSFVSIAAGADYGGSASTAYGLKSDGSLWAWGGNAYGQIGNNTTTSYSSPVPVVGNHSFVFIAAGAPFALALKADGSCWAWGGNDYGQIGNQTKLTSYSSPISVVGNHSFIKVGGGGTFSAGLKADGSIWCWGSGYLGLMGNNTTNSYSSPVSVVGNFNFIDIAVSDYSVLALSNDNHCWSWGQNGTGQLGDNTMENRSSPVSVVGPFLFQKLIKGGCLSACMGAFDFSGKIWAWGANTYGQLGNNTTVTSYSSPILVLNTP